MRLLRTGLGQNRLRGCRVVPPGVGAVQLAMELASSPSGSLVSLHLQLCVLKYLQLGPVPVVWDMTNLETVAPSHVTSYSTYVHLDCLGREPDLQRLSILSGMAMFSSPPPVLR